MKIKLPQLLILPILSLSVAAPAILEAREYIHSCEYKDRQTELTSLACNVYFESRGESRAGQLAIALVTMNRVSSPRYPKSISGVVYQPYQFSWHTDGLSDRVTDLASWNNSIHIASYVLGINDKDYPYVDITDGSLFYHSTSVSPDWASSDNVIVRIDSHLFYKVDLKK